MLDIKSIANNSLNILKNKGAEKAIAAVSESETREFNVDSGTFSLFRTLFNNRVSMTAFLDNKKGSTSTNDLSKQSIEKCASDTIASAISSNPDPAWDFAGVTKNQCFNLGAIEPDIDKLFFRSKELLETIKNDYPQVLMEQMIVKHSKSHSIYVNSKGVEYESYKGAYSVSLMYSAHDGDKCTSFFGSDFIIDNLDTPFIECADTRTDLKNIVNQLDTISVDGSFVGTLITMPTSTMEIIGAALDNYCSSSAILEGTSIWKESLGKQVASPSLTISIDPYDERVVCGERVTDDGFISKPYDVIKDGILNSFMLSLYVANKTGLERANNSSSKIQIKPGNKSIDEIIASTKNGILLGRFSGGSPSINGDFSGVAKNSFLIKDGKIVSALSETMISGNIANALMNIVDISKEVVCDGTYCLPYIAYNNITISGNTNNN